MDASIPIEIRCRTDLPIVVSDLGFLLNSMARIVAGGQDYDLCLTLTKDLSDILRTNNYVNVELRGEVANTGSEPLEYEYILYGAVMYASEALRSRNQKQVARALHLLRPFLGAAEKLLASVESDRIKYVK